MNIYPHVFEAKTRKFGDAKIFHFTVGEIFGEHELPKTALNTFQNLTQNLDESLEDWADRLLTLGDKAFRGLPETYADEQVVFAFVCFVALRPKSTAMVIARRSVHLTTLFPGQA